MDESETTETVPDPVRQGARRAPEAPALAGPTGQPLTYGVLDAAVDQAAQRLQSAGIGFGDRVACLLPRTPAYVVLLLALWRRGAVAAPLPARTPAAGRAPLLKAIGASALIAASTEADELPDGPPNGPPDVRMLPAADIVGEAESVASPRTSAEVDRWPAARPATLVFTSGSTGVPKAALHTTGNHFFSADGARQNLSLAPGDRWLLSLPLYHVGGLAVVFRCLWAGATVVFPKKKEALVAAIGRTGASHVSLVAAQLRRLLDTVRDETTPALASLKVVLLGGGPVPPALVEEAHHTGLPLSVSYGLTEMASQVTATAPGDRLGVLLRTAGRPLAHRRLRIRAEQAGGTGEILVHGRTRFSGYVQDGRLRTPFVDAFGEAGWFATGDLGRVDAAGRLRVVGRLGRRFISGGENVQPEEIEAALRRLPEVADAAVVPVPHETFGQRPVAFIRGQRHEPFHPEEGAPPLRKALRETLATFKVPDAFYPWPQEAEEEMKPARAFLRERARQLFEGEG